MKGYSIGSIVAPSQTEEFVYIYQSPYMKSDEYLKISPEEFMDTYLTKDKKDGACDTKHIPCDFLLSDGNCRLGECRPKSCKKYPYTNQPERLQSLYSVLDTVKVCPVAFEIYERLKKLYDFKYRRY